MISWKKYKSGKTWIVEWSDGKSCRFLSEQKALEEINRRFFNECF